MTFEEQLQILGENIKERRRYILKPRKELAEQVGVHWSFIEKIETAKRQPTIRVLMEIAHHLYLKDWRDLLIDRNTESTTGR